MASCEIRSTNRDVDMGNVYEALMDFFVPEKPKEQTSVCVDSKKVGHAVFSLTKLGYAIDGSALSQQLSQREKQQLVWPFPDDLDDLALLDNVPFYREVDAIQREFYKRAVTVAGYSEDPFAFPNEPTWLAHNFLNATQQTQEFAYDLVMESTDEADLAERMRARFANWQRYSLQGDLAIVGVNDKQLREVDWLHLAGIWDYIIRKTEAKFPHPSLAGEYPGLRLLEDDLSFTQAVEEAGGEMPFCRECFRPATIHLLFDSERCWWCEDCFSETIAPGENDRVLSKEELDALKMENLRGFIDRLNEMSDPEYCSMLVECRACGVAFHGFYADFTPAQGNPGREIFYVDGDEQKLHIILIGCLRDTLLCSRHGVAHGEGIHACPQCQRRYCACCYEEFVFSDPQFSQEREPLCPECHALCGEQV